jgi:formate-dependent nitrite reductase cytochrome c552 subunit
MSRGRPPNLPRIAARERGEKTYLDAHPCWCGCEIKYTSNATCVDCQIAKGKQAYASLSPEELAARKIADHARYKNRAARRAAS